MLRFLELFLSPVPLALSFMLIAAIWHKRTRLSFVCLWSSIVVLFAGGRSWLFSSENGSGMSNSAFSRSRPQPPHRTSEAEDMRTLLESFGVPADAILTESRSLNTAENARFLHEVFGTLYYRLRGRL